MPPPPVGDDVATDDDQHAQGTDTVSRDMHAAGGATDAEAPAGRATPRLLLVLLALAVLAVIVLVAALVRVTNDRDDLEARFGELATEQRLEEEAVVVANDFLVSLFNFDGATIDEDFDRVLSYGTGDFLEEADDFSNPEVRAGLRELQASSRGEVVDLWVQEIDNDRARLFTVVDQTIVNDQSGPTSDEIRAEIGLVREGDTWKVFDFALLQTPPQLGTGAPVPGSGDEPAEDGPAPEGPAEGETTTTAAG